MSFDRLDLSSDPGISPSRVPLALGPNSRQAPPAKEEPVDRKKFVGVKFNCCGLYVRVYINKDGTAYEGRCPKCTKPVRLKIGEGGTSNRFFEAF